MELVDTNVQSVSIPKMPKFQKQIGFPRIVANERRTLIKEAIALHKKKSKLLEVLDEDKRMRLRSVAMNKLFKIPPRK